MDNENSSKEEESRIRQMIDRRLAQLQAGQRGFEASVADKPYIWVLGAFTAGVILGKLLNRE